MTDDAVHESGFLVDDIAIPELGFADDAESDGGWDAAGFVRTGAVLPQQFLIQSLLIGEDDFQVKRLELDENQQNQWEFPM
ncbi:MAG: hypothetical protein ACE5EY_15695, partial [Anaerolineae bacterium]